MSQNDKRLCLCVVFQLPLEEQSVFDRLDTVSVTCDFVSR